MRESDTEGVATHGGPESCVCVREGAGEALTGVRAAGLLSREIKAIGVPTSLIYFPRKKSLNKRALRPV